MTDNKYTPIGINFLGYEDIASINYPKLTSKEGSALNKYKFGQINLSSLYIEREVYMDMITLFIDNSCLLHASEFLSEVDEKLLKKFDPYDNIYQIMQLSLVDILSIKLSEAVDFTLLTNQSKISDVLIKYGSKLSDLLHSKLYIKDKNLFRPVKEEEKIVIRYAIEILSPIYSSFQGATLLDYKAMSKLDYMSFLNNHFEFKSILDETITELEPFI